jgi:hypothetical protein
MWHAWEVKEKKSVHGCCGKPEGKRPLGRPKRRWEDGMGMDLTKIGWGECRVDSTGSR